MEEEKDYLNSNKLNYRKRTMKQKEISLNLRNTYCEIKLINVYLTVTQVFLDIK